MCSSILTLSVFSIGHRFLPIFCYFYDLPYLHKQLSGWIRWPNIDGSHSPSSFHPPYSFLGPKPAMTHGGIRDARKVRISVVREFCYKPVCKSTRHKLLFHLAHKNFLRPTFAIQAILGSTNPLYRVMLERHKFARKDYNISHYR